VAGDIRIGRTLGPYDIEELLGGGGMATVYRGVHRSLGVQRAIKVMSSSLAANDSFVELFYREARPAAPARRPRRRPRHPPGRRDRPAGPLRPGLDRAGRRALAAGGRADRVRHRARRPS